MKEPTIEEQQEEIIKTAVRVGERKAINYILKRIQKYVEELNAKNNK